jgi:hypothetical protein
LDSFFIKKCIKELGDDASLYFNIAYPSLDETVFMTNDGMTKTASTQTTRGGSLQKKE